MAAVFDPYSAITSAGEIVIKGPTQLFIPDDSVPSRAAHGRSRSKDMCRWCHADYYTPEGAAGHDADPDAWRCRRCGESDLRASAPTRHDYSDEQHEAIVVQWREASKQT